LAGALLHHTGIMAPLGQKRNRLAEPARAIPWPADARLENDAERLQQLGDQPAGAVPLGRGPKSRPMTAIGRPHSGHGNGRSGWASATPAAFSEPCCLNALRQLKQAKCCM